MHIIKLDDYRDKTKKDVETNPYCEKREEEIGIFSITTLDIVIRTIFIVLLLIDIICTIYK